MTNLRTMTLFFISLLTGSLLACQKAPVPNSDTVLLDAQRKNGGFNISSLDSFALGADVSWLTAMEDSGYNFVNRSGVQKECMQLLKDMAFNSIRLRVFVNPAPAMYCDIPDVVTKAIRAHSLGMRIMIDFHYSDTWADPNGQAKPAAWTNYSVTQLADAIYDHTYKMMDTLKDHGIYPEWVQVGNEMNPGILLPTGSFNNISNLVSFINKGYDAVKAVSPSSKVIIHLNSGHDNGQFRTKFDSLQVNGAKWDVIGLSLYPDPSNWQTRNSQALTNMNDMVSRYNKEVMVCEVGMNVADSVTSKAFLKDILWKTQNVSGGKGLGVFYWEPQIYHKEYPKKAFVWAGTWKGKPTQALEAFPESLNRAGNSSFEADVATQTPSQWTTWSDTPANAAADYTETSGKDGSYRLTHWRNSAYQVGTSQTVTGLQNGTYTLKAWVMSGGGQTACYLFAKNYGGADMTVNLPVAGTWTQISIPNISVTNGQCRIGLFSNSPAGKWCNLDRIEFYRTAP